MASKRSRSTGGSRPAFGHVDMAGDDDDRQSPGHQSRRDSIDLAAQEAALRYRSDEAGPATGCSWCYGEPDGHGVTRHDRGCPAAGRSERAERAARRLNGLA